MSFNRPALSDIIERDRADIESRLPGADSRLRHSLLDVLMRGHAGTAAGLYGYLDYLARQILPDTADGEHLARHAANWGIDRKAAVAASGAVAVAGTNGVTIPEATLLSRIDGALYRTIGVITITGGAVEVPVEAVDGGPEGDAADGTALTLTSPIAGVQSVASVTAAGLATGAVEEDDASLLARLLQRIQNPPQGGSVPDYIRWALEVDGVTRVWVYPEWLGLGTVGVTFVMDAREMIIPLEDDLVLVGDHISGLRPVTASVTVFAPIARPVDLTIQLTPATDAVKAAVTAELEDMFARDGEPGGTIYLSRLYEAISVAAGESHHQLIEPLENVPSEASDLPVLGAISWVG